MKRWILSIILLINCLSDIFAVPIAKYSSYESTPYHSSAQAFYNASVIIELNHLSSKNVLLMTNCSGTLVKPTIANNPGFIFTSAHCIYKTTSKNSYELTQFMFKRLAGISGGVNNFWGIRPDDSGLIDLRKRVISVRAVDTYLKLLNRSDTRKSADAFFMEALGKPTYRTDNLFNINFEDQIAIAIYPEDGADIYGFVKAYGLDPRTTILSSQSEIAALFSCDHAITELKPSPAKWYGWEESMMNQYIRKYCSNSSTSVYIFGKHDSISQNYKYIYYSQIYSQLESQINIPQFSFLNTTLNINDAARGSMLPELARIESSTISALDPFASKDYKICNMSTFKGCIAVDNNMTAVVSLKYPLPHTNIVNLNRGVREGEEGTINGGDSGGALVMCNNSNSLCKYVGIVSGSTAFRKDTKPEDKNIDIVEDFYAFGWHK